MDAEGAKSRMDGRKTNMLRRVAAIAGFALLAACKTAEPPVPVVVSVPTTPAPLKPRLIPYRPVPPGGALTTMQIPAVGEDGLRDTVIEHVNDLEAVWNFRSAWNVAALNCQDARYQPVLDGYGAFLKQHAKALTKVNRDLDSQYRGVYKSAATREREAYMTQVYNYYATPPAQRYFCEAALLVAQDAAQAPEVELTPFALANMRRFADAFEQFYRDFEQYKVDVAVWDAEYGYLYNQAPATQPNQIIYTNASATEFGFDGSGRVQLNAPVSEGQVVSEPVVQPLPAAGSGQ